MCPVVPSLDTKTIYLPEMTACVWVGILHTVLSKSYLTSKIVLMAAQCSWNNCAIVHNVRYKTTFDLGEVKSLCYLNYSSFQFHVLRHKVLGEIHCESSVYFTGCTGGKHGLLCKKKNIVNAYVVTCYVYICNQWSPTLAHEAHYSASFSSFCVLIVNGWITSSECLWVLQKPTIR